MNNLVFSPIPLNELEVLIQNSVTKALNQSNVSHHGQQSETDRLFTVKETAGFLNLSIPTIYQLVSRGELPVNKKRKRLYFLHSELISWAKQGRKLTNAEIAAESVNYLKTSKK